MYPMGILLIELPAVKNALQAEYLPVLQVTNFRALENPVKVVIYESSTKKSQKALLFTI